MGGIFVFAFAALTDLSLIILVRVAKRTERYSYEKLSDYYLGFWGVRYSNWALIATLFFVAIAFLTIPNETVENLVYNAMEDVQDVCKNGNSTSITYSKPVCTNTTECDEGFDCFINGNAIKGPCDATGLCFCDVSLTLKRSAIGAVNALFVGALGLVTSLHRIAPASTVSFLCLALAIILLFVIFVHQGAPASTEGSQPQGDDSKHLSSVGDFMAVLSVFGNLVIAYQCQYNVLQCYSEMKVPEKIDKLIHLTIFGIALPLYVFVALIGLLAVQGNHESNVFDSLDSKNRVAMTAKWLVVIMAVCKTPLIFNPLRDLLMAELKHIPALNFLALDNFLHRCVVSTTLVIACYFLAWVIPLDEIMAFTGSLFASPAAFILPGLFFLRDCNIHGLIDAPQKPVTGLAGFLPQWASYTKQSKMNFCLAVLSISAGFVGAIAGLAGAINALVGKAESFSIPFCK
eukprot:GEMP01019187.1.p1 GENE.GEMP01019187.1~~GEMP01019187.1.p1  ORF type:complete len:460 (+),score=65.53 GEMP01019187.1:381-1760(+)